MRPQENPVAVFLYLNNTPGKIHRLLYTFDIRSLSVSLNLVLYFKIMKQ